MTSDAVARDQARLFGDETIATPFGVVQLETQLPADEPSVLLFDLDAQRAAQAYFWPLPLVGFAVFRDEQARVYEVARFGDFVVFDSLREKRGIVTANLTTPYILNWTDLPPPGPDRLSARPDGRRGAGLLAAPGGRPWAHRPRPGQGRELHGHRAAGGCQQARRQRADRDPVGHQQCHDRTAAPESRSAGRGGVQGGARDVAPWRGAPARGLAGGGAGRREVDASVP